MKTYRIISTAIGARDRCAKSGNKEWETKHQDRIDSCLESFPSGSGFDSGTKLDESSTPERLVFNTSFHHMNDGGYYDGWTEHQVIITPSLEMGYSMRITGRNRNDIKELIGDYFSDCLNADVPEFAPVQPVATTTA